MKYLAYIDPVTRDDEVNVEATDVAPAERYQMPKRFRKIAKRRRAQMFLVGWITEIGVVGEVLHRTWM